MDISGSTVKMSRDELRIVRELQIALPKGWFAQGNCVTLEFPSEFEQKHWTRENYRKIAARIESELP